MKNFGLRLAFIFLTKIKGVASPRYVTLSFLFRTQALLGLREGFVESARHQGKAWWRNWSKSFAFFAFLWPLANPAHMYILGMAPSCICVIEVSRFFQLLLKGFEFRNVRQLFHFSFPGFNMSVPNVPYWRSRFSTGLKTVANQKRESPEPSLLRG